MTEKMIHGLLLGLAVAAIAPLPQLYADTIGVSVNGTCEAGSCPGTPLPFNSTVTLPVDLEVTLPDGDQYRVFGSFINGSDGVGSVTGEINHDFEVEYLGNATGGLSAADTITVEQFDTNEAGTSSVFLYRSIVGAFSPDIAASSSISTCANGVLGCVTARPSGSFNKDSSDFILNSVGGTFTFDPAFVSNFGAGSPVGSYIV
jgi:hypothetical protein